jgi:tetratricopeptide (TPR) repeat protein
MSHAFMSWFLLDVGQYDDAVTHGEHALHIAVREQDPYSEVLARHSLGRSLIFVHREQEAVDCLRAALHLSDLNGYDAIKPHATGSLAIALARTGRASEALSIVQSCLQSGLHLRTGRLEIYHMYAGYAEALFESGDHIGALATINQAVDIARGVGNPCLLADGLALRAAFQARSNAEAAHADTNEMHAICREHGLIARQLLVHPIEARHQAG